MTVKVVSDKPIKTKRVMCENCHYLLEYTPVDVVERIVIDYAGGSDTYDCVKCPREICGWLMRVGG